VRNKQEYMKEYREKNKQRIKEYKIEWELKNTDKTREYKKAYYHDRERQRKCNKCGNNVGKRRLFCDGCSKEKHRLYMRKWVENNKEKVRDYNKTSSEKLRKEVIIHYGGKCFCCGYNDINKKVFGASVLQIHHMNGDGREHRKIINIISGRGYYLWFKKQNYPIGFGILCKPCNSVMLAHENICEYHKYWVAQL